ncbi:MAG: hypothetical protein IJU74_01705 [Bacteroidales bacterium]|nr:hypothetical protein [Bacteroidales bacterium]
MIDKMTRYSFILLNGEETAFLEQLQEVGLVDITRSEKPMNEVSMGIAGEIELIDGLIKGLEKVDIPEGTKPVTYTGEGSDDLLRLANGTLMVYAEITSSLKELQQKVEKARVWGSFDKARLETLSAAGVPFHFHVLNAKQFQEQWTEEYALCLVDQEKNNLYFVVAGEDDLPGEVPVPTEDWQAVQATLDEQTAKLQGVLGELLTLKHQLPQLKQLRADALSRLDLSLAGSSAAPAAENTLLTLEGYAPTEDDDTVTAALDKAGVFYLKEAAEAPQNPPIRLKNNRFVQMFEVLTDMYGRPAYDGFDPTPFISVFFLLFFAFCMGDAGYGLVLIIIGLFLRKSSGFRNLSPLVVTLGIGTAIIGFLFHTFFSMDISGWKMFEGIRGIFLPGKISGYDGTMVLSIITGVIHICLAKIVKTWQETTRKGFLHSLGTWGWTLLIVGGICVGAFALIGVLGATATKWILIGLGGLSALGIFLFNDLERNKFANIGAGLWETYNTATGLIGDILSYLRLYALGLAGGMLGLAFNNIGTMILGDGKNIVLWIPFILIVLIGHTLNIAMAALGAFVHPLRLNFLEFFKNSGYEGIGRNYHPLNK